jgi:DNA repair photolyase
MEPRTSQPGRRIEAIQKLSDHGISVGVNVAPIIPGLTDHELVNILEAAREAGASYASYTIVRLPHGVKDMFIDWLDQHFPERKEKVLNRIRNMRDGDLNISEFGKRFKGRGVFAEQIRNLFKIHTERLGFNREPLALNSSDFRPGKGSQLDLF